jgi:DNA (cytosine-5)-methyltransferase 1
MKTHIGLFEGIGGFSIAAAWAGYETIAWCEIDIFCQKTLKHYFPHATGHGDIATTDFTQYAGKIDLLTGGFPCQPFSVAGLQRGNADPRALWHQMFRAIREVQPAAVIGENVAGIISMELDAVCADLESIGYKVQAFVIPACAVGAPHRRDRVWIVAQNSDFVRQRSVERQKEPGSGQQWKSCAGSNVGICVQTGDTPNASNARFEAEYRRQVLSNGFKATPNAEHDGQSAAKVAQSFRAGDDRNKARKDATFKLAGCDCEQWDASNAEGAVCQCTSGTRAGRAGLADICTQDAPNSDGGKRCKGRMHAKRPEAAERHFGACNSRPDWRNWENFPTQSPVCGGDDGVPPELAGITVASHRRQSIKAYGNAIVPQVAYQIIKAIDP